MAPKPLIENAEEIRINPSDEIDQILGHPPSWLLQWGITIIFITVLIFGIIAWLIKYPDVIPTKLTIVTKNPVIQVVARATGKMDTLLVTNNQTVQQGTILAILNSPTSHKDIVLLSNFLAQVEIDHNHPIKLPNLRLGALQNNYATLVQHLTAYQYFLRQKDVAQKTASLEAQMEYISSLNKNLTQQQSTLSKEVQLSKNDFERHHQLYLDKVISNAELEKVETQYLQYKRQLEGTENQIISNNVTIEQLKTQIGEINQNRNNLKLEQELSIKATIETLKGQIESWKASFLIQAPISGKISFAQIWSEQQFINANQPVFTIVPNKKQGTTIGHSELPITNSGKVRIGQHVHIQLDGFPFQEYGIIKAKVDGISLVPIESNAQKNSHYLVEISLPDSLVTTYHKTIPFRQKMQGTANIITEDRRILERIFDKLKSILENT